MEKILSCVEISDFCKEFEQFMAFYRNLCRFVLNLCGENMCGEKMTNIRSDLDVNFGNKVEAGYKEQKKLFS